jgi:tRNA modification GTPase
MNTSDTIAAISSAVGASARMIVRASGSLVRQIHHQLTASEKFVGGNAQQLDLHFADLSIPAHVYTFASPHSVTGEDILELHIPGNPLLARMLLDELIRLGARQAEPGEFTARSYFNGRIDLAEAEGVAATIAAQNQQQLDAARQLLAGELARRLRPALDSLAETLALIEAGIDFSEEDISFITKPQIAQRLGAIDAQLQDLLSQSSRLERLSHEPHIVLAGRPNAGKSTLLNALCGHDRAVVSSQAGTTRDAIWAQVRLRRGMVRMIDVAGLENASDEISRQMQQQASRAIEQADHVVLVRDAADLQPRAEIDREFDLEIFTKIDLHPATGFGVSAMTGENLDLLRDRLDALSFRKSTGGGGLALNARHVQAITNSREIIGGALKTLDKSAAEIVAMQLREALDALGQVLGAVSPDDVLGRIFSTFCVGK